MTATTLSDSYFQTQLAKRARRSKFAAPLSDANIAQRFEYLPADEIEKVKQAFTFADQAHKGQMRRTGHQYVSHPLAVADILAGMKMDYKTVSAGLLHDVIEDSSVDKKTISRRFGKDVAEIVDGVSKLDRIFESQAEADAQNFQKLVLATARDVRVILVKLADRLHNMRTLGVMSAESRQRLAQECLELYAPIANRLGIRSMMTELQDLAFESIHPLRADRLGHAIESRHKGRSRRERRFGSSIRKYLQREGITADVSARHLPLYEIYRKMKSEQRSLDSIMEEFGFRVVVADTDTCYRALGHLHSLYTPRAQMFRDYIAIPKTNGYQSLHTTVLGPDGETIKVQIRTNPMDEIAEHGIAGEGLNKRSGQYIRSGNGHVHEWIRDVMELQRDSGNPREFIENLKIDLFPDELYVFTPKGEIITLPQGACAVDFAFAISKDTGNHCVACRINRAIMPLSTRLSSGQTVEIVTAKKAKPNPMWLGFVSSVRARTSIRETLGKQRKADAVRLGQSLLDRALENSGATIQNLDFRRLRQVFSEFNVRRRDDLFAEVGSGNLMAYSVAQRILYAQNPAQGPIQLEEGGQLNIPGGQNLFIKYAECCRPIPGDRVIGHVSSGEGFVVHRETCPEAIRLTQQSPMEVMATVWSQEQTGMYETPLDVSVQSARGVLAELVTALTTAEVGINGITVTERTADLEVVSILVSVNDLDHLDRTKRRLQNLDTVQRVSRPNS